MVLEQVYSALWVKKKPFFAFLMGICYTSVSIGISLLVFPEDPSMAAVFLTSLMLIPTLNKILTIEEDEIIHEKKSGFFSFIRDHKDITTVYLFLFIGVLLVFALFNLLMPSAARTYLFEKQLLAYTYQSNVGYAASVGHYLEKNIPVLILSFAFSLLYGSGAILIIIWNAAAWGSIFGDLAQQATAISSAPPIISFITSLIPVLPHTLLEGAGYFLAAIAGGVLSKAVVREKWGSDNFRKIWRDSATVFGIALVMIILGAIIETRVWV